MGGERELELCISFVYVIIYIIPYLFLLSSDAPI